MYTCTHMYMYVYNSTCMHIYTGTLSYTCTSDTKMHNKPPYFKYLIFSLFWVFFFSLMLCINCLGLYFTDSYELRSYSVYIVIICLEANCSLTGTCSAAQCNEQLSALVIILL